MDTISFRVLGTPAPKGSVTRMRNGSYLPAGTPASRMNFELWKGNVAAAARVAMEDDLPALGPIKLTVDFLLPVPTSGIRKQEWGWAAHVKRPDLDKLVRGLLDPLTGIVWVDDSQVAYVMANKHYAFGTSPGAVVTIDFPNDEWVKWTMQQRQIIIDVIDQLGASND